MSPVTSPALRPATLDDVAAMAELERSSFGADAWSPALVEAELGAAGGVTLVAHDDHGVLGYAVTRTVGDVADLQRVVVAPRGRRRGLARALLRELLVRAADDGASRMLLEVSAVNHVAVVLYAGLGFVEIDRRASYYRDGSDALVMSCELEGAR